MQQHFDIITTFSNYCCKFNYIGLPEKLAMCPANQVHTDLSAVKGPKIGEGVLAI